MSTNGSSNGEQSSKPWWKQIPIPRYGVAFVIIVLILTALASSFFGADDNPKLSISQAASAEGKTQSLLYPMRDTRWVTDSALPELGSPTSVFQVVPLESGESAATNALKSFAEHFGRTGALTTAGGNTIIEVTPYGTPDTANGNTPTGAASFYDSKLSAGMNTLQYSAMQVTGSSDGDSGVSGPPQDLGSPTQSTIEPITPTHIGSTKPTPTTALSAPRDIPNEAALLKIARDVLRSAGIDSSDWQSVISDGSSMTTAVACAETVRCEPQETTLYSRQVVLTPLVDSIPVHDLNWYVEVGDKGVVLSASGAWVKAEKIGEYSRRGTQSAITALQAGEVGIGFGMRSESDVYKTTSIDSAPPNAGSPETDSPNRSTFPPNPGPSEIPEPDDSIPVQDDSPLEPRIVTIKRVEAGYSLQFGAINGKAASLLVPTYTFFGTATGVGSEEFEEQVTLNALDPSLFAPAKPAPGTNPDNKPTPEPLLPVEPQTPPRQTEPVPMPEPSLVPLPK